MSCDFPTPEAYLNVNTKHQVNVNSGKDNRVTGAHVSTVCDPVECSPPGFSVCGIFQARILEWVAISSSRGIFLTWGWNTLLHLLHWQMDSYH